MKIGTESRNKVIAALVLGVLATVVIVWQFSGYLGFSSNAAASSPSTPALSAPDPAPTSGTKTHRNAAPSKKNSEEASLDPTLRLDLLKASEDTKYEGNGRNIFMAFVPIPPVIKSPVKNQQAQAPQGPPQPVVIPPPPIPLTFYGFATPAGGAKRVFLAQGEDVFIAKEGDIVDRRYKVVRISANAVEILDVLSNNRQSIPLTQG